MLITEDQISIDKSNMYDVLKNFPSQVEEALNIAGSVKLNSSDTKGINNIIIASKTLEEHIAYLNAVFAEFRTKRISIKPIKAFLGFLSVKLLS